MTSRPVSKRQFSLPFAVVARISGKTGVLTLAVAMGIAVFGHGRAHGASRSTHEFYLARTTQGALAEPWLPVIVGQEGGDTNGVAARGGNVLLGVGPRLVMLDVADPSATRVMWRSEPLSDVVADVAISGDTAYAVHGRDLTILDLTLPTAPTVVGQAYLQVLDTARRIVVSDGFAYVLLDSLSPSGVAIVDVRDPYRPSQVATDGWFLTNAQDIAVADGYAYVAPDMHVVDIADPEHPVFVARLDLPDSPLTVAATDHRAYACSRTTLYVVDAVDPAMPELVGTIAVDGGPVAVYGDRAFVAGRDGVLTIVDVADPGRMEVLETVALEASAADVVVADDRVLVAAPGVGLRILDAAVGAPVTPVGGFDVWSEGADVQWRGGAAYVAAGDAGLAIVDVTELDRPRTLGTVDTGGKAHRVALDGESAFVATVGAGVAVVSVLDPLSPTVVARIPCDEAEPVLATGAGLLFLLEPAAERVHSFDVADSAAPRQLGVMSAPGWAPSDALVSEHWLFVADRQAGLRVLDAGDPSVLRPAGRVQYVTPSYSRGLSLFDGIAYAVREDLTRAVGADPTAADGVGRPCPLCPPPPPPPDDTLVEIDVRDPNAPGIVRDIGPVGWPKGIAATQQWVFAPSSLGRFYGTSLVARSRETGEAFDVRLPAIPTSVVAVGDHAIVVTSNGGLLVIEMRRQAPPTATVPPTSSVEPVDTPTSVATASASATPSRQIVVTLPFAVKGLPSLRARIEYDGRR